MAQDYYPQDNGANNAAFMQQASPTGAGDHWQLANASAGDGAADPASLQYQQLQQQQLQQQQLQQQQLQQQQQQQQQVSAEEIPPNTVHVGTVTKMNINHVRVTVEGFADTVYVHESVGAGVAMGDIVAFQIHVNAKGQCAASSPAWKLVGAPQDGSPIGLGEYVGRVAQIIEDGSAQLTCPALQESHGCDAFAHSGVVSHCGFTVGDVIAFCLQVNQNGQPQVTAPCWKCCSPGWRFDGLGEDPMKGKGKAFKGKGNALMDKGGGNDFKGGSQLQAQLQEQHTQLQEQLHELELNLTGDEAIDAKIRAMMESLRNSAEAQAAALAASQPQQSSVEQPSTTTVYIGSVSAINPNHCLVVCEGVEGTVYMHEKVGQGVEQGDTVAFQIHVNARGQPQASSPAWKLVGNVQPGTPVKLGEYVGKISKMLPNGSAFLSCPAIVDLHGSDPFVHNAVVSQCNLTTGDVIAFCAHISKTGQPQVSAPCWKCCSPGWRFDGLRGGGVPASMAKGTPMGKGTTGEVSITLQPEVQVYTQTIKGETDADTIHIGTVTKMNPNHARVTCEGFADTVYVHEKVGVDLALGDTVAFQVHINARGQPAASSPAWKLVGAPVDGTPMGLGDYVGKVAQSTANGGVFLTCPALQESNGSDAFAHADVVAQCSFMEGDIIAFCSDPQPGGQPEVNLPCWKCCSPGWRFDGLNEDSPEVKLSKGVGKFKGKASMWKGKEWMDSGYEWMGEGKASMGKGKEWIDNGDGWQGGGKACMGKGKEWMDNGNAWKGGKQSQPTVTVTLKRPAPTWEEPTWEEPTWEGDGEQYWPPQKRQNHGYGDGQPKWTPNNLKRENVVKALSILAEALG